MSAFCIKAEGGTCVADRDEIHHALSLLIAPSERHELMGLPGGRRRFASGDDLGAAVDAAVELSDGQVYYSVHPLKSGADRANNGNMLSRRWLFIDIDPVKPADTSSTEVEKVSGHEVVCKTVDYLLERGWPGPVIVDSGNGWHLLFKVDLPNDKLSQQLIKAVLANIADHCDTDVAKVDRAVHDARRMAKLPGTMARKGVSSDERPHRMCRIAYEPETVGLVTVEQLQSLVVVAPPVNGTGHAPTFATRATETSKAGYVKAAVDRECYRVALAPSGERNTILNDAAFRLGTMAGWPEADEREIRGSLQRAAGRAGLAEREILLTIASGWSAGKASPRQRPEEPATASNPGVAPGTPLIVWASSVKPKKVEWLWPRRIPLGKMTTFAGNGGLGKTFVLCDIAARVSTGSEWPYCGGECAETGKTLFISGEDDADDTIVPRLMECGADLRMIAFLSPEAEDNFTLAALDLLTRVMDQMRDVRLVAIDPPTSYLDGVDDHRNSELRSLLTPLKRWCADQRVAVVLNNHVNKSIGKDVEAASRVMGSVAWVNAVRAAHMFIRDEDDNDKVHFAPIKINVGKFPMALTYQITPTKDDLARVEWIGEIDQNADEVLGNKKKTRGASAVEWLSGLFGMQREWRSDDLRAMAKEVGVSKYALFESPEVKALPIDRKKRSNANGEAYWIWRARDGWPIAPSESSESSESCSVSPMETTHMEDSERVEGGRNLGSGRDLGARGQDSEVLPRFREGSGASECWKDDKAKGLTEQDSEDSESATGPGSSSDPRFDRPEGWKDEWMTFDGTKPKKEEAP